MTSKKNTESRTNQLIKESIKKYITTYWHLINVQLVFTDFIPSIVVHGFASNELNWIKVWCRMTDMQRSRCVMQSRHSRERKGRSGRRIRCRNWPWRLHGFIECRCDGN